MNNIFDRKSRDYTFLVSFFFLLFSGNFKYGKIFARTLFS